MPLKQCQNNGKSGWKYGDSGKCFTGPSAREKARKQGVAIKISQQKKGKSSKADRPSIMDQVINHLTHSRKSNVDSGK